MAIDYTLVGLRIRRVRKKRNLTQDELSELMNVSVAYLSKIETGKIHINLPRLSELCRILQISEGYILDGTSSSSTTYMTGDFAKLLSKCTPAQQKLIYNLALAVYKHSNDGAKD